MDDEMLFDEEDLAPASSAALPPWELLIVDDEPAVHQVTQLVMADFELDGRRLHFSHCYSGAEARAVLDRPGRFALILLDVVMETEHAGLDLVRYIRDDLHDAMVRIVLRTGQPGQAPQALVLKTYDINDYREKTELTHAKLNTVFFAGLRAYRDLMRLERARLGLRRSIDAITEVGEADTLRGFCSAVLEQAGALLGQAAQGICACRLQAYAAAQHGQQLQVLAVTEAYAGLQAQPTLEQLPEPVRAAFTRCLALQADHGGDHYYACYHRTAEGNESLLYMAFDCLLEEDARELLGLFAANVATTFDKLLQRAECEATQSAMLAIVGDALERRVAAAGGHVTRVGEIAAMLGEAASLAPPLVRQLRQAAPLHDIGHCGLPEALLNYPGPLDAQQWSVLRGHSSIGHGMLAGAPQPVLQMAAQIALQHHERWDGSGYPHGLAGAEIALAARITSLADFVDAMLCPRSYRAPHTLAQTLAEVRDDHGHRFDPALAAMLLAREDFLQGLYQRLPPH